MKKLFYTLSLLLASAGFSQAQTVTLNCETAAPFYIRNTTNNRNYDIARCFGFGGVAYSQSPKISGNFSTYSGAASSMTMTSFWAKSPWLKPGTGNVYMKTKLSAVSSSARYITLAYIPYNAANPSSFEGTRVDFYTYTFSTTTNNTIEINQPMPAAIAGSSTPYKIMALMYGNGGSARILTDDWIISGTYWANPSASCAPLAFIVDADSDGVADADDDYPNDGTRAYDNFYPAAGFGTLMFEDLWPATGDYDFNDLVVDYRYNLVTDSANKVVEMKGKYVTRAIGASFHNGFAFQLDNIPSARITGVTGASYHGATWLDNGASGAESGQTFANVVVFDDAQKVLPSPGGSGSNTIPANPRVAPDTTSVTVTFSRVSGQKTALADVTFNPYIIIDQTRGKELHLPNYIPSSKVNTSFFGQMQDDTKPGSNKYYKTINNLPWALNVSSSIPYTHTTNDFVTAYLKFAEWAQSSGTLYTDWYLNNVGYRDASKLFVP
jgi:LruC domain-containing protein